MRRTKIRRSLSLNSSLDIQQKVAASWLESEEGNNDEEEEPAFRWDKFQSPHSVVDISNEEQKEGYRWDQSINVPSLPKMTITKPLQRGISASIPKPSCLRNRGISAPVVEAAIIPKPSCLKQRGLSATVAALKEFDRKPAKPSPTRPQAIQRGVSAPIKTDVFDWESFHTRNSMPCGRNAKRRPTPPRGGIKKTSNGSLPIFEDDDDDSTHSFMDESSSKSFRPSLNSTRGNNSLEDTEHSKVYFRGSIRIFEIPRYCDKKEGNKEEYFYTKQEIKTFKAEKKQEKREAKKKEKRRQARSLSPAPRNRRKDMDESFH